MYLQLRTLQWIKCAYRLICSLFCIDTIRYGYKELGVSLVKVTSCTCMSISNKQTLLTLHCLSLITTSNCYKSTSEVIQVFIL